MRNEVREARYARRCCDGEMCYVVRKRKMGNRLHLVQSKEVSDQVVGRGRVP